MCSQPKSSFLLLLGICHVCLQMRETLSLMIKYFTSPAWAQGPHGTAWASMRRLFKSSGPSNASPMLFYFLLKVLRSYIVCLVCVQRTRDPVPRVHILRVSRTFNASYASAQDPSILFYPRSAPMTYLFTCAQLSPIVNSSYPSCLFLSLLFHSRVGYS